MRGSGDRVCCTFSTYNVLGLIFGGLVVGVAAWLAADKNSFFTQLQLLEEEEGQAGQEISIVDYGAFMLVGIGVAILVQSLLGCISTVLGCCGNRRAKGCLITYGILITIVVIVEIVAAVLVLNVFHAEVSEETKQFLEKTLKTDYKHPSEGKANDVTVLWDTIMTNLGCCGVNDYLDFMNEGSNVIPAACCLTPSINSTLPSLPESCPDPADGPLPQMIQGCYPLLVQGSIPAIAASLTIVAIFQVAGIILACCLATKVETSREWYEMNNMY